MSERLLHREESISKKKDRRNLTCIYSTEKLLYYWLVIQMYDLLGGNER